jgi:hypothetical protein
VVTRGLKGVVRFLRPIVVPSLVGGARSNCARESHSLVRRQRKELDTLHFIHSISDWQLGPRYLESEFHEVGTSPTIDMTQDLTGLTKHQNGGTTKPGSEILLKIVSDFRNSSQRFDAFLLYTVHRSRGRAATDPADLIYAPLSLVSRWKTDTDSLPPVDYALSVPEIYTKFSSYLMRVPRSIVLSFQEDGTDRPLKELPSWVPDYSVHGHIGVPVGMQKRTMLVEAIFHRGAIVRDNLSPAISSSKESLVASQT